MGTKAKRQNKFIRYVAAPFKLLSKARDFYMKTMFDCAGRIGEGSVVAGCALPQMTRLCSFKQMDNEDLRALIRVASTRTLRSKVERDLGRQVEWQKPAAGARVVGRSYSVGVGKIGRIDEDLACDFVEVEGNKNVVYPRCRSYAVTQRIASVLIER
ncbi:hypothetical protein RJ639_033401 [Escallonia herrerae]|uniref:Uncharacterized protein n=1 Tax=Escallonia herrerae TaxID=1293975 RepID=A0AA89BA27_9ASTE|nr:hypothetical protein RJ639_033401 [Escallonia herrerae]